MTSRLWQTLTHFFDYKPDINVKFQSPNPGPSVVVVHRSYRIKGGEDAFLSDILIPALLALNISFEVIGLPALFSQKRFKILDWLETVFMFVGLEKLRPSYLEVMARVKKFSPRHVIFNNVIPTVSLALPKDLHSKGIKTHLWVHNSRVHCANGLSFNGKEECNRCLTSGSKWAFIQKCFPTWGQSLVYSFVYRNRRVAKHFTSGIDNFISVSNYTAKKIQETVDVVGQTGSSTEVIRHPIEVGSTQHAHRPRPATVVLIELTNKIPSPFYSYIGRLSYEKGVDRVLGWAKKFPNRGFLICGEGPMIEKLKGEAPKNVALAGFVEKEEKEWVFRNTAALLIPSRVPETSSLTISESQSFGTPVVFPSGGGAEETFKLLKRSGCPLEEFNAQDFKKTEPEVHEGESQFAADLKRILGL